MKYGIIFDLDGTLADTIDDLKTAVNDMLTRLHFKNRTKAEILSFINNGSRELIRRSLPTEFQTDDSIIDNAHDIFFEEYEKCFCKKTKAFPKIYDALVELKQKGFKLGVLSNKPDRFVKAIIFELFGDNIFDFAMGKNDFPHKPHPSSALYVSKKLGIEAKKCIFVGDSDIDMLTAKNADMHAIGVKWGYRSAELLLSAGANYVAETPKSVIEHLMEYIRLIKI